MSATVSSASVNTTRPAVSWKRACDWRARSETAPGEANVLFNLSILALRQGDPGAAASHAQASLDMALAMQDPEIEFWGRFCLANAKLELGQFADAEADFERARAFAATPGGLWILDALTGLARVALARNEVDAALNWLNEPLARLAEGSALDGAESPMRVLLTCHRALAAADDLRAGDVLRTAHARLLAKAELISDLALRRSYLNQVPEHSAIMAAWAASNGPDAH